MEYKVGQVWFSDEFGGYVKTVLDENGSCSHCVFSEDKECGASCPAKSYNSHPCYCSEREDGKSVHFEEATQEEIDKAFPYVKIGDKVLWDGKRCPVGKERRWNVCDVSDDGLAVISTGDAGSPDYCEVEVPVLETIKII